jgi:RNA-binding protein PNO1
MEQKITIEKITKKKNEKNLKVGFQVDDDEEINEEFLNDNLCDDIDLEGNNDNIDLNEQMNLDKILKESNNKNASINNINSISKTLNTPVPKEYRKIVVPVNKLKALKENWPTIVKAIIDHMKLEIRMNAAKRTIEMRTSENTTSTSAMQKSEDFLKSFLSGFDLGDSIALLRLEDLYYETFDIKDVKALKGDHLARCIGRICGEKGKTKHAIENSTRTRLIVEGHKISLLGAHVNVGMARSAICSLILGAQPGKVYSHLRIMGRKLNELM